MNRFILHTLDRLDPFFPAVMNVLTVAGLALAAYLILEGK